jgi:hypothetical protein
MEQSPLMHDGRILVVGTGTNPNTVAKALISKGESADWTDKVSVPSIFLLRRFEVVYGIYLQTCSRYILAAKFLGKKTIIHFVGSDAYWYTREKSRLRRAYWRIVLRFCDAVVYVSPHLRNLVGKSGVVIPLPIATFNFKDERPLVSADRDILYYCPSGPANEKIYRLDWIIDYARSHPEEQITIVGSPSHPARYSIALKNVEIVPYVESSQMPSLYRKHKKLIRMTTEDGLPVMVHEALLCGLQVIFNGQEVREIPKEREPAEFAAAVLKVLDSLRD